LTVNYTVSGTATAGSDYVTLSGSVVIPAGAVSASVTLTPLQDTLVEGNESVVMTLAAGSYTIGTLSAAVVTLADDDVAGQIISLNATHAVASEAGPDAGVFTVIRSGSTASALTVNYTISGTATPGSDYVALSGSVNIPAGAASASLTLTPLQDTGVEGTETVVMTLAAGSYTIGAPGAAQVMIADDDVTGQVISLHATDAVASEAGLDPSVFTVIRSGSTASALTVNYTISGTATPGSDYAALSGSVTLPPGAAAAKIAVSPVDDLFVEGNETIALALANSSAYTIGTPNDATVTLADNDTGGQIISLIATDPVSSEAGLDPAVFTVARSGPTASALTVNYAISGTAAAGSDYVSLSGNVTIPAGASAAEIIVTPTDDLLAEGDETVSLTLAAGSYTIATPSSATVTLQDNDSLPTTTTVTLSATDPQASEAGLDPGVFTVTRSGPTTDILTVNYTVGGTATAGSDYTALSGSVVIPRSRQPSSSADLGHLGGKRNRG
jgi:hypothetical protein